MFVSYFLRSFLKVMCPVTTRHWSRHFTVKHVLLILTAQKMFPWTEKGEFNGAQRKRKVMKPLLTCHVGLCCICWHLRQSHCMPLHPCVCVPMCAIKGEEYIKITYLSWAHPLVAQPRLWSITCSVPLCVENSVTSSTCVSARRVVVMLITNVLRRRAELPICFMRTVCSAAIVLFVYLVFN